jgi:serine/threonine protein kinase
MANLIGQTLGRYYILGQLGEGGMATVYKARDMNLNRDVAVKVIRTEMFGSAVLGRILERFKREAQALAKLTHPNIVSILDYGEYQGAPYLVMSYLPGGTLKSQVKKPIPYLDALRLLMPIAQALAHAHDQGIIHRDVKPANILITRTGEPMLSDFGIAKLLDDQETRELTGTGVGIGTPEYMAPEQGMGQADERADIYALGIVFYELVTGRIPYRADTPMAILIKKREEPLPRPKMFIPSLPDSVENVLIKALARNPQNRYQSMREILTAFEHLILGDKIKVEKPSTNSPAGIFTEVNKAQLIAKNKTRWIVASVGGLTLLLGCVIIGIILGVNIPLANSTPVLTTGISTTTSIIIPTSTVSSPTPTSAPPTELPLPTSTPTPVPTSTPIPQKILLRPSCGETYSVQSNMPLVIYYGGWAARGIDLTQDNVEHLNVEIFMDGNQIQGGIRQSVIPMSAVPCGDVLPDAYWIFNAMEFDALSTGKHSIKVRMFFDIEITDGYDLDIDGNFDMHGPGEITPNNYVLIVTP